MSAIPSWQKPKIQWKNGVWVCVDGPTLGYPCATGYGFTVSAAYWNMIHRRRPGMAFGTSWRVQEPGLIWN